MTCIVAVEDGRRVWMGGDSALAYDGDLIVGDTAAKVWTVRPYVMGAMGSARACSALRYLVDWPKPPRRVAELERFFATDVTAAIRKAFDANAITYDVKADETGREWAVMIGVRGHLYTVGSDLYAGRTRHGYHAIGCGAWPALGALYSLGTDLTAEQRCRLALEASAAFIAGVAPPFKLVHT